MAQAINRLSARAVQSLTAPGRHSDGGNLYLYIAPGGSKSWAFMYKHAGKQYELGLGSARDVSLARAREIAREHRAKLAEGINPKMARQAPAGSTFLDCANAYIAAYRAEWTNAKHAAQWGTTLAQYAKPLHAMPVADIETEHVLAVLQPIWTEKRETASRLRGRIELVLSAAKAQGLRTGENPAQWRGHLDHLLAARPKNKAHLPAMDYRDVPEFMAQLRARDGIAWRALEFSILTASRAGETLQARWSEFDLDRGVWTIPAARMKARRPHTVPLSPRALAILDEMARIRTGAFVFPGRGAGRPLNEKALNGRLQALVPEGATAHGFRSSFRDWCGDATSFPRELAEAALAHSIGDASEQAYRRGDALERRRELMTAWSGYCAADPAGNVVALRRR